jgi:integrase/recombinase XerD
MKISTHFPPVLRQHMNDDMSLRKFAVKPQLVYKLSSIPVARNLPIVLNLGEIKRFLAAAPYPKYHAAFSVAYGAGLRVSEVVSLKISDIDKARMALHVEQGKGRTRQICKAISSLT